MAKLAAADCATSGRKRRSLNGLNIEATKRFVTNFDNIPQVYHLLIIHKILFLDNCLKLE